MKLSHITASILALGLITACGDARQAAGDVKQAGGDVVKVTKDVKQAVKDVTDNMKAPSPGADISAAPAGTYKSEATHAYITFQYLHQGYARPTLRWNDFEATIELDPANPTASSLTVTIDASSVDSGVAKFDAHMKSGDMFDVENHPTITFTSTALNQTITGKGTLTGDLTIKGITKPVTLDATLNKVGAARDETPMFGISASTRLKRSEWDIGYAVPFVGDDVDIMIEVEFRKEG